MTDPKTLIAALDAVPEAAGRVGAPRIEGGRASIVLDVTSLDAQARTTLEKDVEAVLGLLPGVTEVRIALTSEKATFRLIAVGSGKGGVGKSTVAANLAIALKRSGLRVGLVDADIYGPSQPRLMATEGARAEAQDKRLIPIPTAHGIPMLSMGHLIKAGQAIAWRGPMASGALGQLIDADWAGVDWLIVDLPPGTGDVQLSMVSKHKPAGAVIVTTPQDLSLIDATRAIDLFRQTGVPVIGVVENMSGYACPHCGEISDPFGSGGGETAARDMDLPFLGRIPLDIAIRRASDAGTPPAAGNGPEAQTFAEIAAKVAAWIAER